MIILEAIHNGMVPYMVAGHNLANDDPIFWCIYTSLDPEELTTWNLFKEIIIWAESKDR